MGRFLKLRILVTATLAAIIIGGVAWLVKHAIAVVAKFATSGFKADQSNWWMIILGVLSITLTGWIVRHIVKPPLEHGTIRLKADIATKQTLLPLKLTIAPVTLNVLTLGLGGSAGAEGPIAYSGAAISTRLAKWFDIPNEKFALFLACGAGAGIAAIFKAPLGGVFFTLEILGYAMTIPQVLLLIFTCMVAGLSAYAFGNAIPDIYFTTVEPFAWKWYLPATILGIICGLYSLYYRTTGNFTARKLRHIKKAWLRNIIAGLIVGGSLFIFPSLYGEGYGVLSEVLNGNINVMSDGTPIVGFADTSLIAIVLVGILLIKGIATYATNSGGGVAGEFAPTIFAGGMLGALFSILAVMIPQWELLPVGDFIVLAMAAVMAGVIQAPLMAIFIVVEMTAQPILLLPLCLTSAISYVISKSLTTTNKITHK